MGPSMEDKYRIYYSDNGVLKDYTVQAMTLDEAKSVIKLWECRYWDFKNNRGRIYPNGKGFYNFTKAQIVRVK